MVRMAVGFLGQARLSAWWTSSFLSSNGFAIAEYNFPRSAVYAAMNATSAAAKRLHDERIGKRRCVHLADAGVEFIWRFDGTIHDRELRTDTGWSIRMGRGLDIYQRTDTWIQIGASNLNVRPCMETRVSIIKTPAP
jgi:hypothetical protein